MGYCKLLIRIHVFEVLSAFVRLTNILNTQDLENKKLINTIYTNSYG